MRLEPHQLRNFWSKVNKQGPTPAHMPELGPCWIWIGSKSGKGYGRLGIRGKLYTAHRISLLIATGIMPSCDLDTCHACDNPSCVNPGHLSECTRRTNLID